MYGEVAMTFGTTRYRLLSLLVAGVGFFAFVSPVWADGACQVECFDQFDEDLAVCEANYQQTMDELDLRKAECIEIAEEDPIAGAACWVDVASEENQALLDYLACQRQAEGDLAACINECEQSPAAP